MAYHEFDDVEGGEGYGYGVPPAPVSGMQRLVSLAGALTTVAMIAGVAVWGYKIAVRDANGIPVVRALEGPMRVAPSTPGGSVADHQGLAINRIAADGSAAPLPDQIVLAPEAPGLSPEDLAGLATPVSVPQTADRATQPEAVVEAARAEPADSDAVADALVAALAPDAAAADADMASIAEMLALGATPLTELSSEGAAEAAPVVSGGVARSLRPQARPAGLQAAVTRAGFDPVADAVAGALSAAVAEVDPDSLKKGERLVQLGAFDDAETARSEWDKLAGRFGELMSGKGRVIQSAQSGGRTFYRLRAHGFDDEADARRFCSALLAEDAACIPVAIR